jgi:hypothetical protein
LVSSPQINDFGMQHGEDGLNFKAIKQLYLQVNLFIRYLT